MIHFYFVDKERRLTEYSSQGFTAVHPQHRVYTQLKLGAKYTKFLLQFLSSFVVTWRLFIVLPNLRENAGEFGSQPTHKMRSMGVKWGGLSTWSQTDLGSNLSCFTSSGDLGCFI